LKTAVFKMSCTYGERQFGVEDQGWVAWFTIATLTTKPHCKTTPSLLQRVAADQKVYISDIRKEKLGWKLTIPPQEGVRRVIKVTPREGLKRLTDQIGQKLNLFD
jgi:hypothetical protein